MDDLISRQQAIDDIWTVSPLARLDRKWVDRWLRQLPSANCSEIPNNSDTISRQAAIDAIGERSDEIYKTKQKGATYPHDDFFQGMAYAENVVKQLPSAQPEQCEDAVSRLEIIRNLHKYFKEGFEQDKWWNSGHVIHAIMDAPSVTPKQRTGKWIRLDMHRGMADHKCTACEQECYVPTCMGEPLYAFCPNCGAKMEVTE